MATDPFDALSPEVAALFAAARETEPASENSALFAAMADAAASGRLVPQTPPRRKSVIGKILTAKVAAIVGALMLSGGAAAAATGTLPDPVQDVASDAADVVGVNIPHGKSVSTVARDKSNDGEENHGKTVSETARDNHGHNKDTTTTTAIEGDDNRGPGNSNGAGKSEDSNASDNARNKPDSDDDDDDDTTSTTIDDDAEDDADDDESDDIESGKARSNGKDRSGKTDESESTDD